MAKGACGLNLNTQKGKEMCAERIREGCKACGGEGRPNCPHRGEASKYILKRNNADMELSAAA